MTSPASPIPTQAGSQADTTSYSAIFFVVAQAISRMATSIPVQVIAVTPGGVGPVGYVDVQPLVDQIDPTGASTPHGILHNLPYVRIQGGANALIIDPAVGDIGMAMFASHDISKVKTTKSRSVPGSRRRFSMADGIYLGGTMNGTPTQYVLMNSAGIKIVSTVAVEIDAPTITLNASNPVIITPDATIGGKQYLPHHHSGVSTGSGVTGPVA